MEHRFFLDELFWGKQYAYLRQNWDDSGKKVSIIKIRELFSSNCTNLLI